MKTLLTTSFMLVSLILSGQEDPWLTRYESSGFRETPRYQETVDFCRRLGQASPWITYTSFGVSPQGRELPLLILDRNGNSDPAIARKSGNLILMVQAGIHSGEIDGKDALLMFFRDIAIRGKFSDIPGNLTILFIPIFNVDGHERFGPFNRINQNGPDSMGWRTTAQNLNLNRDYLKADSPEMKAWLRLFQAWMPDFFIDIHVTDGADYQYVSTYGLETFGNMDPGLTAWVKEKFEPYFVKEMDEAGMPIFPYVMFRKWHDPRSGLRSGPSSPRLSTGYAAARNRIGLLIENHSLKDYRTRVSATYEMMVRICRYLDGHREEILALNRKADETAASPDFRMDPMPVEFRQTKDSMMVDFRGVEYEAVESDLTGGTWFRYDPSKPRTYRIPYLFRQEPSIVVDLPEAYIIPSEWEVIISRLQLHGIQIRRLTSAQRVTVESYKLTSPDWSDVPYEGHFTLRTAIEKISQEREYPAGSAIIDMDQGTARVIAFLLEPASPDSYLQWGFFDPIFEMKEYFETYIMEPLAGEMTRKDPSLLEEFNRKKESDSIFAGNQWAQLEWFFNRTPYADSRRGSYPIGRINDPSMKQALLKSSR